MDCLKFSWETVQAMSCILHGKTQCFIGNIGKMLATCLLIPTLSAKNQPTSNVVNIVIGYVAGSHVCWCGTAWLPYHIHGLLVCYSNGDRDKGHFLRKKGNYTWINGYNTLFVTFSHQSFPLQSDFLPSFASFSLCPKTSANMWTMHQLPTCWHVDRLVLPTYFDYMLAKHLPRYCLHAEMSLITYQQGGLSSKANIQYFWVRLSGHLLIFLYP